MNLHIAPVWEMQCRENGVVSTIETHLDFVVITRGDHDVGNLRGKHQALQFVSNVTAIVVALFVSWDKITLPPSVSKRQRNQKKTDVMRNNYYLCQSLTKKQLSKLLF